MKPKTEIMGISEYAKSGLYKSKEISSARVWQLIRDKVLILAHENPAIVFAKKVKK